MNQRSSLTHNLPLFNKIKYKNWVIGSHQMEKLKQKCISVDLLYSEENCIKMKGE